MLYAHAEGKVVSVQKSRLPVNKTNYSQMKRFVTGFYCLSAEDKKANMSNYLTLLTALFTISVIRVARSSAR
jgi:hypothetical protein